MIATTNKVQLSTQIINAGDPESAIIEVDRLYVLVFEKKNEQDPSRGHNLIIKDVMNYTNDEWFIPKGEPSDARLQLSATWNFLDNECEIGLTDDIKWNTKYIFRLDRNCNYDFEEDSDVSINDDIGIYHDPIPEDANKDVTNKGKTTDESNTSSMVLPTLLAWCLSCMAMILAFMYFIIKKDKM